MDEDLPEGFEVDPEYNNVICRRQAEGAYLNGSQVVKVSWEPRDSHPVGTKATIIGSIELPDEIKNNRPPSIPKYLPMPKYMYWVRFSEDEPIIGILDYKIRSLQ